MVKYLVAVERKNVVEKSKGIAKKDSRMKKSLKRY
jgi:hypothetical protein